MSVLYLCRKNNPVQTMVNQAHPGQIQIGAFDYRLPDKKIAQYPLENRDQSRLLICKNGSVSEDRFLNLAEHLPEKGLVIFNETRVIHARLLFQKDTGSFVEIFCLEPVSPHREHQQAFRQTGWAEWHCLVGNSKRWNSGRLKLVANHDGKPVILEAERVLKLEGGISRIRFSWTPADIHFAEVLEAAGKIPLPPYIHREPVARDESAYQTIFASQNGSVAAPTAALHFSEDVLSSFSSKNIDILKFTLHVGAGTFRPVTSENLSGHEMHAEQVYLPVKSLEILLASLHKPLIAVGTTTTRLLESIYWHGVKVINGLSKAPVMDVIQWDPYDLPVNTAIRREEALEALINGCKKAGAEILQGKTSLMIAPGYQFRFPDILITNFHQPRSTLLLLISAFIGEDWRKAYQYALEHDFRFLSYGDGCLFFKST